MSLTPGSRLGPYDRRSRLRPDLALASGARLGEVASTGRLVSALRARSRGASRFARLLRETWSRRERP
jgi:hypothetical protein